MTRIARLHTVASNIAMFEAAASGLDVSLIALAQAAMSGGAGLAAATLRN